MASSPVPAKSQPLHYFSLPPQWKWNNHQNHHHSNNHHHRGRSRFPDRQSPPTDADRRQSQVVRRSPITDSDSGYAAVPIKHFAPSGFSLPSDQKSETKSTVANAEGKERRSNSKIYIRLPKKKPDDVIEEGKACCSVEGEAEECQESVPKTWNLRPRRPLHKQSNGNGGTGTHKIGVLTIQENTSRSPVHQNRPDLEVNAVEKKQKFSISLSREEIEEDIFALTGAKPSRRPKKRSRAVQKQLDNLFPGLWLGMISPDSYKVSDAPPKV